MCGLGSMLAEWKERYNERLEKGVQRGKKLGCSRGRKCHCTFSVGRDWRGPNVTLDKVGYFSLVRLCCSNLKYSRDLSPR